MDFFSSPRGRVLIVDDEPSFIKAMKREFADDEIDLLTAEHGEEALERLRDNSVDVIISDLKMRQMGGLEFIAAAKRVMPYETRYMVMTGWGEFETAVAAMRLGVVEYLTKPIDILTLRQAIHSALEAVRSIRNEQRAACEASYKHDLILATVQAGVLLVESRTGNIVDANAAACGILDCAMNDLTGCPMENFFPHLRSGSENRGPGPFDERSRDEELTLLTGTGRQKTVQLAVAPICLDGKDCYVASFMDISKRKKIETDLLASRETFSAIVERSLDGIVILSTNGKIRFLNPAAVTLFAKPAQTLIDTPFGFPIVLDQPMELPFPSKTDPRVIVEMRVAETSWQGEPAYVATLRDITERKRLEEDVKHMAMHDHLTGLPNRNLMAAQLEQILALAKRKSTRAALLFIDLDNFKPINDNFGHAAGDAVLRVTAQRLKDHVRASDLVARVGGDEFFIALQEVNDLNAVILTAERIIDQVGCPIKLEDCTCRLGASIGISLYPDHSEDTEMLIKMADTAMYQVKKRSKNGCCTYEHAMGLIS